MTSELPSEAISNYPVPTLKVILFYPATQATIKVLSLTFSYGYFFPIMVLLINVRVVTTTHIKIISVPTVFAVLYLY